MDTLWTGSAALGAAVCALVTCVGGRCCCCSCCCCCCRRCRSASEGDAGLTDADDALLARALSRARCASRLRTSATLLARFVDALLPLAVAPEWLLLLVPPPPTLRDWASLASCSPLRMMLKTTVCPTAGCFAPGRCLSHLADAYRTTLRCLIIVSLDTLSMPSKVVVKTCHHVVTCDGCRCSLAGGLVLRSLLSHMHVWAC